MSIFRNKKKTPLIFGIAMILILSGAFYGCGTKESASAGGNEGESSQPKPDVVKVAAGSTHKPYCFVDENNVHTGYEVDLLKEVDKRLPEYEFEITATTMDNILLGLESGEFALGTHNAMKNPEREEKFLFPAEDIGYKTFRIIVQNGTDDIKYFDDLVGHSLVEPTGKFVYTKVQSYNKENPDKTIDLVGIDEATAADRIKLVAEGRYDAAVMTQVEFDTIQKELALDVKVSGIAHTDKTYFMLNKSQEILSARVNEVLKEIRDDGTMSELSLKWLGEDCTKAE